jgi:hypothetical protein
MAILLLAPAQAPRAENWKHLWNGRDLTGWVHVGPGRFVVEDGALKTMGGMGLLYWSRETLGDCVIRLLYKPEKEDSNAGVFIRIPEAPTEPWMPVHRGYEVQIHEKGDDQHRTGVLYSFTTARARPGKVGAWNTLQITLDGPRTEVTVNGAVVTDFKEGDPVAPKKGDGDPRRGPRPVRGYFGLQNHGDGDVVSFKEIVVQALDR